MGKKTFDDSGEATETHGEGSFQSNRGRGGLQKREWQSSTNKRYFSQNGEDGGNASKKSWKRFDDDEGDAAPKADKSSLYENTVNMTQYGYQKKSYGNSNYEPQGGFGRGRGRGGGFGDRRGGFGGGFRKSYEDSSNEGGVERRGGFRKSYEDSSNEEGGERRGGRGFGRGYGDDGEEGAGQGSGFRRGGFGGGRGGFKRRYDDGNGDEGGDEGYSRRRKRWNDEEGGNEEEEEKVPVKSKNLKWENAKLRHWRIIIRNLPFKTTKEDLIKACEPFGEFTEVVLPKCKDKKYPTSCAGFGFVQYKSEDDADKALKGLNESEINGRKVAADWTMPKDTYETAKYDEKEDLKKKVKIEKTDEEEKKKDEEMEVDDEDEEEEDEDEEEDEEDSDEDDIEDSEDDDDEEEDGEKKRKKKKAKVEEKPMKADQAVLEQRVLFIRNLSFNTTDETLKEAMKEFGNVKLAIICKYADSGHSKGTAFVHFETKEEVREAMNKAVSGDLSIDGRVVSASIAMPREDARRMDKEKHQKMTKDKRNLLLARVGIIREGTNAAAGMSKEDTEKRKRLVEMTRKKLENLHMFISPTRLAIHNIPFSYDDYTLRKTCQEAAGPDANVVECRIWKDMKKTDEKGSGKSRGYGFVAFSTHSSALKCLQTLNNNPKTFTNDRRPIVEFSIENLSALKLRESRLLKSQGVNQKKKVVLEQREDPTVLKEVTKTTSKMKKAGMKPLPLRMSAKIRTRDNKAKREKNKKKAEKSKSKGKKKEDGEGSAGGAKKKPGKASKKTLSKYLAQA